MTTPQTGYAPVNGLNMYHEIHGAGEPLILLHGGLGTTGMFGEVLSQLAANRQVIAADLQAHGRTADIDRPIRLELMGDDVAALIRHLGFQKVDVMGYSMGGGTALRMAIQHPALVGKLVVARRGLGKSPLRTLFRVNVVMWTICIFFTLQSSIVLLTIGLFIWLCLIPVVEASEQTILQKLIVPERQGRVFGFAQSVEQAASPVTAFVIGPIAQFIFIPFMTTGAGVDLIGGWFGTGTDRGIALVFIIAGLIGLVVTLLAIQSKAYRALSQIYQQQAPEGELLEASA